MIWLAQFPSLGTSDVLDSGILCCGGWGAVLRMVHVHSHTCGFHLPDAGHSPSAGTPNDWIVPRDPRDTEWPRLQPSDAARASKRRFSSPELGRGGGNGLPSLAVPFGFTWLSRQKQSFVRVSYNLPPKPTPVTL